MHFSRSPLAALLTSAALAVAPHAIGQEAVEPPPAAAQPPASPATPATPASYSEAELQSFAVAAVEVQKITNDFVPRVQAASTPQEKERLVESAHEQMIKAVQEKGISVDKYQEILQQARSNPAIANKVEQHLQNIQQ